MEFGMTVYVVGGVYSVVSHAYGARKAPGPIAGSTIVRVFHQTVDTRATPLAEFIHPEGDVTYVFGGVFPDVDAHRQVSIEIGSEDFFPLPSDVAVGIVLHDRLMKERHGARQTT
jgi:hypothetical protein